MRKVLIAGVIHQRAKELLSKALDLVIEEMDSLEPDEFIRRLPEVDALLIRTATVPEEAITRASRLRVVARHGVGYDNLNVLALTRMGIPLALVGSVNCVPVAEQAFSFILALAKRSAECDEAVRRGDWGVRDRSSTVELYGRSLLLLGLGRVGRELAKRAIAFGMRVFAHDPYVDPRTMAQFGVEHVPDWREILLAIDFLSLHLPLTAETRGIIGADELAAMKSSAFLINTARGGLVDERALAVAIATRKIAGAGLDVLDSEPPMANNPLFESNRILFSPHSAALTEECYLRMGLAAARNVLDGLEGKLDPALVVNPTVLGGHTTEPAEAAAMFASTPRI
jgi:D-3-phosphoglycerate dehydrogenase / 2-oxoglutarate reductase